MRHPAWWPGFSGRMRMGLRHEESEGGLEPSLRERGGMLTKDKRGKLRPQSFPYLGLEVADLSARLAFWPESREWILVDHHSRLCSAVTTSNIPCKLHGFARPSLILILFDTHPNSILTSASYYEDITDLLKLTGIPEILSANLLILWTRKW